MAIYHFDYREDGTLFRDRLGSEIDSMEEARAAAINVLVAMAHARWERSEPHNVVIEVRGEEQVVLEVALTLEVTQLAQPGLT